MRRSIADRASREEETHRTHSHLATNSANARLRQTKTISPGSSSCLRRRWQATNVLPVPGGPSKRTVPAPPLSARSCPLHAEHASCCRSVNSCSCSTAISYDSTSGVASNDHEDSALSLASSANAAGPSKRFTSVASRPGAPALSSRSKRSSRRACSCCTVCSSRRMRSESPSPVLWKPSTIALAAASPPPAASLLLLPPPPPSQSLQPSRCASVIKLESSSKPPAPGARRMRSK
mmetsp:Transcript_25189/g.72482  ORF Transcript_25189/g.72482 Transcript_25189/m.72482 type:complete len:235 (-) Transcript_25189:507-1211(-)